MNVRLCIILFFKLFFGCLLLNAQQIVSLDERAYIDSLSGVLASNHQNIEKAKASFELSSSLRYRDSLKSQYYLKLGNDLSGTDEYAKALRYFYEADYIFYSNPDRSATLYKLAAQLFSKYDTSESIKYLADSWFYYGLMLKDKNGYDFFMDIAFNKSIPLLEKIGSVEKKSHYYMQIGALFTFNRQYEKSEEFLIKAYSLLDRDKHKLSPILLFTCLFRVSNLSFLHKAKEAKILIDEAYDLIKDYPESINLGFYYLSESQYLYSIGDYKNSLISSDKGLETSVRYNLEITKQLLLFNKSFNYYALGEYMTSKDILILLLKEKPFISDPLSKLEVYNLLHKVYAKLHNMDDAYRWSLEHNALNDSLNQSKFKQRINELEVKYNAVENQRKIAKLESEKSLAELSLRNSDLHYWLMVLVCFLMLLMIVFLWVYYKKNKKLILQKEVNHQQQLKELSQLQQLNSAKSILKGEEKERKRLAQDLHDGLGGILANIKMNLSKISEKEDNSSNALEEVLDKVDYSLVELRRIARNMMPESLFKFGLNTALKDLCELYGTMDTKIGYESFQISNDISEQNQILIYRIIQELLSNSMKHSQASLIMVQCSQNQNTFFITVEDNGKGFDKTKLIENDGMGLINIKNRVSYLGGNFHINSDLDEGTMINIELDVTK